MYLRFKLFGRRFVMYQRKVVTVKAVNSSLDEKYHIPMIDCDTINIINLMNEVSRLQQLFELGDASICSTGRPSSFHVYFWTRVTWRQAVMVASMCHYVDLKFLEFSLRRGHFTLRISDKKGRPIKEIMYIKSSGYVTKKWLECICCIYFGIL